MNAQTLIDALNERGYRAAAVPAARIDDLYREYHALAEADFHNGFMDWWAERAEAFSPKDISFEARSLLIVAQPSPVCDVRVQFEGRAIDAPLPPTYADHHRRVGALLDAVRALLEPHGLHAAEAHMLPHKLLAVRSGLGQYGRNNICYVNGFGSYMNLFALYTDTECERDPWRDARQMDACADCGACASACPTGAIDPARMIIDADACLTALNEFPGAFPDWLDPHAHACLVGCMRCQAACPVNAPRAGDVQPGCTFTEDEARAILAHEPGVPYPPAVAAKLDAIGLTHYGDVLPRNLAALIGSGR